MCNNTKICIVMYKCKYSIKHTIRAEYKLEYKNIKSIVLTKCIHHKNLENNGK
jgi:hypothetical protein